jgi:hypothetical protein
MPAANDKSSKEATGLVVEFSSLNKGKANGLNNYLAWAGAMSTSLGARYGPITRVFNDQMTYKVLEIEADDIPQKDDPGIEGDSAANLDDIRVSVITAHVKKKRELRDELPRFFNYFLL